MDVNSSPHPVGLVRECVKQGNALGSSLAAKQSRLSLESFTSRYSQRDKYVQPKDDPFTAKFADEFFAAPEMREPNDHYARKDFRLNKDEYQKLEKNGFVVSQRLGKYDFTSSYYSLYSDDFPVFITADSILHAWHVSYVDMLCEIEMAHMLPTIRSILDGMRESLKYLKIKYRSKFWKPILQDVDLYLTVARSLLIFTKELSTRFIQAPSSDLEPTPLPVLFDTDPTKAARIVKSIRSGKIKGLELFGSRRQLDGSMFTPRGHYVGSLAAYFQAMTWLGYVDFRITGGDELNHSSLEELAATVLMYDLLVDSKCWSRWQECNSVIQTFIGVTDSMNFVQLSQLLKRNPILSEDGCTQRGELVSFQRTIEETDEGKQSYASHEMFTETPNGKANIPRSFVFIGQCFSIDNWAYSMLVKDKVSVRRIPSCLDAAFTVFGNDNVTDRIVERMKKEQLMTVDELIDESVAHKEEKEKQGGGIIGEGEAYSMTDSVGVQWRDGINYCGQLDATRKFVDALPSAFWDQSIVFQWLQLIRTLSKPSNAPHTPKIFRSEEWSNRVLNTQLASYTQLRHDTVLYTKPVFSLCGGCSYPEGYVEPNPQFWKQFQHLIETATNQILRTKFPQQNEIGGSQKIQFDQIAFLTRFSDCLKTLHDISVAQENHKELSFPQKQFLRRVVESVAGSGQGTFSGWYCKLYYHTLCTDSKAVVTDIYTDPPDAMSGDRGCVVHEGTGHVGLMIVAVDDPTSAESENKTILYAGPTSLHYEFAAPASTRLQDSEWRQHAKVVSPPEWTRNYCSVDTCCFPFDPNMMESDDEMTISFTDHRKRESPPFKMTFKKTSTIAEVKQLVLQYIRASESESEAKTQNENESSISVLTFHTTDEFEPVKPDNLTLNECSLKDISALTYFLHTFDPTAGNNPFMIRSGNDAPKLVAI